MRQAAWLHHGSFTPKRSLDTDRSHALFLKRAGTSPLGTNVVGVLTGVRGDAARREKYELLVHSGVEAILEDVTELPDWLEGQLENEPEEAE